MRIKDEQKPDAQACSWRQRNLADGGRKGRMEKQLSRNELKKDKRALRGAEGSGSGLVHFSEINPQLLFSLAGIIAP